MKHKIYSSGVPSTPKKKPPRFDIRNRTKKKTLPSEPKPEIELEKETVDTSLEIVDKYSLQNVMLNSFLNNNLASEKELVKAIDTTDYNKTVKIGFNSSDWVFTQATAVASVNMLPERPWQITADTIKYVNSNGNSWETNFLKSVYKTFKGAMNLKDHIDPEDGGTIYGIIVDAIPRKIKVPSGHILYIDTMIATNRHTDPAWARAIEDGKINFLSVGFVCNFLQCSKCGHIYKIDGTGICEHCAYEVGLRYTDQEGRASKVSAIATDAGGVGVSYFDELSYLSVDPAFRGACKSYKLDIPKDTQIIVEMPLSALDRPAMKEYRDQYEILDKSVKNKIMVASKKELESDFSAMLLNRL